MTAEALSKGNVEDALAKPEHDVLMTECHEAEGPNSRNCDMHLNFPGFQDGRNGNCDFKTIYRYQKDDPNLQASLNTNQSLFTQLLMGYVIICRHPQPPEVNWKIMCPTAMLPRLVKWHHETLMHSEGADRLYATVSRHF